MNQNLKKAHFDIMKADSLMFAIETAYLDIPVDPSERERADRAAYAFYALWDVIKEVEADIGRLEGDERVVDAIRAAKETKLTICTLKSEE